MKKLLLSVTFATCAALAVNAQTLTFLDSEGKTIENGATYTFEGWKTTPDGIQQGQNVGYAMVKVDPELSIKSFDDDLITVSATSKTGALFQLCAGGNCVYSTVDNPTITKEHIDISENQVIPLQLEAIIQFMDAVVEVPYYEILVEAWSEIDPENKITMTLKMGDIDKSGVESSVKGNDMVKVVNNVLSYDVTGSKNLSVYSLVGKAVINRTVAGNGSINLGYLPKGVYVYKLAGAKGNAGKFVIE